MKEVEKWLKSVRALDNKIKCIQEQLERTRSQAEKVTTNLSGIGGGRGMVVDRTGDLVAKLNDEESRLEKLMLELVERRAEIGAVIEKVDNSTYQTLLYSRYILLKPWWKVAQDIGYSEEHARKRIARDAVSAVKLIFPKDDPK